jgi:uncharacterized protein
MLREPLALSHQDLIRHRFQRLNLPLSEYSFPNLYLFRQLHHYEVLQWEEHVFIKGLTRDKIPFILLTTPPSALSNTLLSTLMDEAEMFFPIPEPWIASFNALDIPIQTSFKLEDSDYLFKMTAFATYAGRHLNKKRNLVKQLLTTHTVRSELLTPLLFSHAQEVLNHWQQATGLSLNETDYTACQEAIQQLEELILQGRILYIDDKPVGLIIGEWITADCYAVHFAKGLKTIHGIYQYLYQDLAIHLDRIGSWINLEQDLGVSQIQQTKRSYQPDHLLHKWRVKIVKLS